MADAPAPARPAVAAPEKPKPAAVQLVTATPSRSYDEPALAFHALKASA